MTVSRKKRLFTQVAERTSEIAGKPLAFLVACLVVLVWFAVGPFVGFTDSWQLVINTGTTIVTFLMVFPIQNTQNRDSKALQIKLDELIRATEGAHNALLDLEELEEEELKAFQARYEALAAQARMMLARGLPDTGTSDME
jgi:low affinity Fe/Cu permease